MPDETQHDKEMEHWKAYERIRYPHPKPPDRPIRKPFTSYVPRKVERSEIMEIA